MKKTILGLLFIGLGVISNVTYAQSLLADKEENSSIARAVSIEGFNEESNWAVYADEDNRKFYIDFEKLHIYLDKITVLNEKKENVFSDNLWNLPANTIYEIDMTDFPKGNYQLEFKSLTDEVFYKNFEIK
jgi:hypothetical protein